MRFCMEKRFNARRSEASQNVTDFHLFMRRVKRHVRMQAERVVVEAMAQCKQPDMGDLQKLVEPVGMEISAADKLTHGRRSAAFNYCKAVAEALPALSWVVYSGPSCGKGGLAPNVCSYQGQI